MYCFHDQLCKTFFLNHPLLCLSITILSVFIKQKCLRNVYILNFRRSKLELFRNLLSKAKVLIEDRLWIKCLFLSRKGLHPEKKLSYWNKNYLPPFFHYCQGLFLRFITLV